MKMFLRFVLAFRASIDCFKNIFWGFLCLSLNVCSWRCMRVGVIVRLCIQLGVQRPSSVAVPCVVAFGSRRRVIL